MRTPLPRNSNREDRAGGATQQNAHASVSAQEPHSLPAPSVLAQAKRGAIEWAQDVCADDRTVYLDTETTGLDGNAEIIEIALIDHDGSLLFESLVRPMAPIPPDSTRIHGITNAQVRVAAPWSDVWPQVAERLIDRRVVVYNAPFDYRMLRQVNTRDALPVPPDDWQCAMRQYALYAAVWHARYGNFRWHRLDDALARFSPGAALIAHRAAADASACRLIVAGMAASNADARPTPRATATQRR